MNLTIFDIFANKLNIKRRRAPIALTASRALTKADKDQRLVNSTGTAMTLTIPAAGLGADFSCEVIQAGAGAVTVAATGPATVTGPGAIVKTAGAGSKLTVEGVTATTYVLNGAGATA